ncbi:MAG: ABC transporter permease subunit [Lachnospiraceae bacterium]
MVKKEKTKKNIFQKLHKDYKEHKMLYLMIIPVVLYYMVFEYGPIAGVLIAFKDYRPARGIFGSDWIGFKNFITFFNSYYFWSLIRNTLWLSIQSLIWGFPAPILLALLLNEARSTKFKKSVQTITYMPHFISTVVIAGMIVDMVSTNGVITQIMQFFGYKGGNLLYVSSFFVPILVISDIWQNIGWGTIIYIAALTGIPEELYEAAEMDGAKRLAKVRHITLPGIAPTIVTMFILKIGNLMTVGWEKIVLLSNSAITDTAQVISSFVYTQGLLGGQYSYTAAIGLFNSIINFILIISANAVSRKINDTSLW